MFNKLLLSSGGGIISNTQKDEQESCATLAIGLGGTGVSCLRSLKRMVYDRLQADDPKDPMPSYSHIKFLAVDTDRSSLEADGKINSLDEATEFFDISSADIQGLLKDTRTLAGTPECQWLKAPNPEAGEPGLKILSATAGAGGVRQIGRLLIIEKSDAFVNKVRQLVTEAKKGFPKGVDVNVHIFSGLGGGTGSGTFLDVCYLVQKALDDIGEGGHALTCGYFFLPDVNLSIPQVGARQDISSYIQANGFAAMKELDYCMNYETNGGHWDQQYRGFKYGTNTTPVKCCHLISANALNGAALANGYDYAMNVVGDFVMQFLVKNDINMTTHIANYYTAMGQVHKDHGANYQYIVLGASNAVVPIREITTYLASKLFEAFSDFKEKMPTNDQIAQFAKENGLDFQGLLKLVMDKTSFDMTIPPLQESMFRGSLNESDLGLPNDLILPDGIMTPFRTKRNAMASQVETNIAALTHDWRRDKIRESDKNIARVWKVFFALEQVVADPDKGPLYASAVLYGSGRKNLVDILQGNLEMIQKQLKNNSNDVKLRMDAVKKARGAYLRPGFMQNRQRLFDTFIAATASYFELTAKTLVLEKMQGMILKMMEQFKQLYSKHFAPYWKIYNELLETFHENYRTMSDGAVFRVLDDPFIMRLLELDDHMKELLDKAVESLDLDQEARKFNDAFFKADDVWVTDDESKIVKFVSDYVIEVFDEYTQKTITKYLEMRFDTTDPLTLQGKIYSEILRPLSDMATPLFWRNPSYNPTHGNLGYISVPGTATVINGAANKLIEENNDLHLVKSAFANRIFLLRCLCGVPMYGYNGVGLYKQTYKQDAASVGRHIYERSKGDPRDWRVLSDLQPYSTVDPSAEQEKDEKNYNRAVEKEIVRSNPNVAPGLEYQLVEYAGIEAIAADAKKAKESKNAKLAQEVISALDEYLKTRQPVKYTSIPNDGSDGNKEKVRLDHFMDSLEMRKAVREQLAILDQIDTIREDMKIVKESGNLEVDYRNALYTGVIKFAIPKVTYTKVQFGMTKETKLSEPGMKPYGHLVPLYQGFVTFSGMDEKVRKEIQDTTMAILNDTGTNYNDIKAACDSLQASLSDMYMGAMQMQAQKIPGKTEIIEEFFVNLRIELTNFRLMYGIM